MVASDTAMIHRPTCQIPSVLGAATGSTAHILGMNLSCMAALSSAISVVDVLVGCHRVPHKRGIAVTKSGEHLV